MLTKEEVDNIRKTEGEVRGTAIRDDLDYVRKRESEEQIKKVKKRMEELGCEEKEITEERIKAISWYPLWCHVLFLVILYEEMGWTKDDIFDIGYNSVKSSLIFKVFPKYLFDLEKGFAKANAYWRKNFSVGQLKLKDIDLDKKYSVFNLKNFNVHPLECHAIKGYFVGLMTVVSRAKDVKIEETKCPHRGNKFHQFKITWK